MRLGCRPRSCVSWPAEGRMTARTAFFAGRCWRQHTATRGGAAWGRPWPLTTMIAARHVVSKAEEKPPICTADELHYVSVPGTEWQLALWRYTPSQEVPARNHPLLLLSGVATNAIGYDLSPGCSFARHMSSQGFDTWILEVRGAGLSRRWGSNSETIALDGVVKETIEPIVDVDVKNDFQPFKPLNGTYFSEMGRSGGNGSRDFSRWNESELASRLSDIFMRLAEGLSGFLNEGQSRAISANLLDIISKLLEDAQMLDRFDVIRERISSLIEARQNSAIASQIKDLSQRLVMIVEDGQKSVSPQLYDLQERLATIIDDFQKQLDLIVKYDWDFDHYLEEDVPAAMRYILEETGPKDGKLLAIGHSMGGILLYAMLASHGFEGSKATLAAVVTLASSLDYTSSNSSLKLLLPLADPVQALNVPVVPLGALLTVAFPLCTRPPYVMSWLNQQITADNMMHPELFEKLVLNNFCTVPVKVLLQLTTAFRSPGLQDRSVKFCYNDHIHKCDVPVLALAGDKDLICPPKAVYETAKRIPQHLITYKVFGGYGDCHYSHYDIVGGRMATTEVYPYIDEFLAQHDAVDRTPLNTMLSIAPHEVGDCCHPLVTSVLVWDNTAAHDSSPCRMLATCQSLLECHT